MKNGLKLTSCLLLIISLLLCSQKSISQGTDLSIGKHNGMYIGMAVGPSRSKIINKGTLNNISTATRYTFISSFEFGYFFSKYFGITSGIGYAPYKSMHSLNSYDSRFPATDSDNEAYDLVVNGSAIQETQIIGFLSIPVCLNLRIPIGESSGMFFQGGADLSVPMNKTYESSGTFTYQGYYTKYNVMLKDLPQHGFPTNLQSNADGDLELKPIDINFIVAAGFDFSLGRQAQLALAIAYDKSLANISKYESSKDFQLSLEPQNINSFMAGSTKAATQLICLKLMFRFYFR